MQLPSCSRAILVAAALGACQPDDTDTSQAPLQAEGYYTLDQQRADMAKRDAERKAAYIPGLRAQIAPADWIQYAYHGDAVDANFDPVVLAPPTIDAIQQSIYDRVYPSAGKEATAKYGDIAKLFAAQGLNPRERAEARQTVLDGLLTVANQAQAETLRWRVDVVRGGIASHAWQHSLSPSVLEWIARHGIPVWTPPPGHDYIEACRAQGVPIPPNWPDPDWWYLQGELAFNFLGSYRVEVHTYTDPSMPDHAGICYALPRTDADGEVRFLGIICQNNTNGKACFWDNILRDNSRRLLAADYPLRIGHIGDGYTLTETCTSCHRGDNVFNLHPGTALDVDRRWTRALTRFSPIARPGFSNPPPISLASPPSGQRACNGCHSLPALSRNYCVSVLTPASRLTMPENWMIDGVGRTAGWDPGTVRPDFNAHISALRTACATAP
jgi:hypothetical protein